MNALLAPAPAPHPDPGAVRPRPVSAACRQARISPAALIGVSLAHAALLGLLAFMPEALQQPRTPPRPLMVSLVQPVTEKPRHEPPPPQPERPPVPRPPRPAAAPVVQPAPVRVAKPAPAPLPLIEAPAPIPESAPLPEPVATPVPSSETALATTPAHPADYLANPKPPYPALSKRLGEEGQVRLSILVNPDGSVAQLELLESSGHPRLDRSAIVTVRSQWKFEPARQGGRAVAAWVVVPIQFTLRS